ncbi:hypothetical protein LGK95_16760 [Clostridium algoriphilum]|nr:hypothetical protein [Clostridium algoriphilum]MCB2295137.1 hypothetical protein [Clostridium algoriphilum]
MYLLLVDGYKRGKTIRKLIQKELKEKLRKANVNLVHSNCLWMNVDKEV